MCSGEDDLAHRLYLLWYSFLSRIKWLQDGSRVLFGKVCGDCIYILIDTSHSMTSKLDLVKDKIIRLIWVRRECHGLVLGLVSHKPAFGSPCLESAHCPEPHCTKGFLRKPVQKCTPSAVLELSQCSLAIRPVLWLGPLCRHHPWVTQVCIDTFRLELSLTYDTQKPLLFPRFLSSWIFNLISYVS